MADQRSITVKDLARRLGSRQREVRHWIAAGRLVGQSDYLRVGDVRSFLLTSPDAYDLRRVDQTWLKKLFFGELWESYGD